MGQVSIQNLTRSTLSQTGPPPNAVNQTFGFRYKGQGDPNGKILGYQGDSYIDLDSGAEWNKLADDNDGKPTKTGWYVEAPSYSITDYEGADVTGAIDSTSAFTSALADVPAGGVLRLPDDATFLISSLTIVRDDIKLYGRATIKAASDGTTFVHWTGSNVEIEGITFDGQNKRQACLFLGESSQWWTLQKVTIKNFRVTDANDPTNTASTGSATAVGVRLTKACQHFRFLHCDFLNISFDGIKPYLGGVGRTSRGILGAPFPAVSAEADANIDIVIHDCKFINESEDRKKIDNDAIVFQNVDLDAVQDHSITITDCLIKWWGWRGLKMQCSGFRAINNEIISGTELAAGVADVDGYLKCMRSAIEWFGHNAIVCKNRIHGGTIERVINPYSFSTQCTNSVIHENIVTLLSAATSTATYVIFLKSARRCSVQGNIIKYGDRGIHLRGKCEDCVVLGNIMVETGTAGILVRQETDSGDPFENEFPDHCVISGNIIIDGTTFGIQVTDGCTNINVYGTQGSTGSTLVNIGTTVTGQFFGNPGGAAAPFTSLSPLTVVSSSGAQEANIVVSPSATDTIVLEDQAANKYFRVDGGTLQTTVGNTAGTVVLAGTTRVVRRRTTYTTLSFNATMVIDLTSTETQRLTQAGAMSVGVSNPVEGQRLRLEIIGDGNAITWDANLVTNTIGTALPGSIASGKIALFEFESPSGVASAVRVRYLGVQA